MRDSGHLSFDVIDQNPYRDLIHNPVREEQVEQLAASVRSTGYWHNTMVRPHPTRPGRYQLAYGHARLEAARRMGLTSATFTVRDLSDERMIHVMADENITQFGKDRFATCKEATVAATWLMRAVIEQREGARRFLRTLDAELRCGNPSFERACRQRGQVCQGRGSGKFVGANLVVHTSGHRDLPPAWANHAAEVYAISNRSQAQRRASV